MKVNIIILMLAAVLTTSSLFYGRNLSKNFGAIALNKSESGDLSLPSSYSSREKIAGDEYSRPKLLFVGDMMFDRWIRQVGEKKGYDFVFKGVEDLLKNNDLIIGNLEGPITDKPSVSINTALGTRNNYIFTFDSSVAGILKKYNINLVNLGNNHILNFGQNGLMQTEKYLADAGVDYFCSDDARTKLYEIKNIRIGLVCYNQFENDAVNKTLADIDMAKKQADFVVLYTHWGIEYNTLVTPGIKTLAHQFISAGADAIIGSHPHVTQEKEEYQGKMIYYSLGNFIFDQYFNPEATRGLAIGVSIDPSDKKLIFEEYTVQMKSNGQTVWPPGN